MELILIKFTNHKKNIILLCILTLVSVPEYLDDQALLCVVFFLENYVRTNPRGR